MGESPDKRMQEFSTGKSEKSIEKSRGKIKWKKTGDIKPRSRDKLFSIGGKPRRKG